MREALAGATVDVAEEDGRFENFTFEAASPEEAFAMVLVVFDSPKVGRAARASCIVVCQGEHGWDDYLLLHHYDRSLIVDALVAPRAE